MIDKFDGKYSFLSNFYECGIDLDGFTYPSVEHAYQAAKTLDDNLRSKFREGLIHRAPTAGQAKRMGRTLSLRKDWDDVKVSVMRELVRQKFFKYAQLGDKLLETQDRELIEGNTWGDRFWGVCGGSGLNMLGKILMEVRKDLSHTWRGCLP